MLVPPVDDGGVKLTDTCVSPAVAVPMVGAPGTTAATVKDCATVDAAAYAPLPDWSASMVQVPAVTKVSAPPLVIVHTPVVLELKVTARPELAVAVNVGDVPKFCVPGLLKVIVCAALGVTLLDAVEAGPVPTELVAVTVNVYAVPLVRPVTTQGELAQVPVMPPGLLVAV
jgi:hypothetical protein